MKTALRSYGSMGFRGRNQNGSILAIKLSRGRQEVTWSNHSGGVLVQLFVADIHPSAKHEHFSEESSQLDRIDESAFVFVKPTPNLQIKVELFFGRCERKARKFLAPTLSSVENTKSGA